MKVLTLQGTPKLDTRLSITGLHIEFLENNYEEHSFENLNIGKDIVKTENDESHFNEMMVKIERADLLIWVTPVYTGMVPANVKRFIELISERGKEGLFRGKYTGAIVTSAGVMDDIVVSYLRVVSEDMGCRFVDSFCGTALPCIDTQYIKGLRFFMDNLLEACSRSLPVMREFNPISAVLQPYNPDSIGEVKKSRAKKIAIITDITDRESNLAKMVDSYVKLSPYEVEIVNLSDTYYHYCSCCLGCSGDFNCKVNDGFKEMLDKKIITADGVIIAGEIKERFLSARIKTYIDREFTYNHVQIHKGRLFGLLISGPLRDNSNIRKTMAGWIEMRGGSVIDIVSDEFESSETVTTLIGELAVKMAGAINKGVTRPLSFLGHGAQRMMRDLIYVVRFPFVGDYKFFKKHHFKGLPHKQKKATFLFTLLSLRAKFFGYEAALADYMEAGIKAVREQLIQE